MRRHKLSTAPPGGAGAEAAVHVTLAESKGDTMKNWMRRRALAITADEGMATAEYALVTVAAAAFAGVLIALLKSQAVRKLLSDIITSALGG